MFDLKKHLFREATTTKTRAVSYTCNCYYYHTQGDHLFAPLSSHHFAAKGTWNGLWGGAGRRCSVLLEQARGLGEAMIWKETCVGSIDANGKETPLQNTSRQHVLTFCWKMFIEVHFRCGANAVLRYLRYFKDLHSVFNREVHFECWFQVLYLFCIHWTKILNLLCAGSSPSQIAWLGTSCQLWEARLPPCQMATCCYCWGTPWMKSCHHPKRSL